MRISLTVNDTDATFPVVSALSVAASAALGLWYMRRSAFSEPGLGTSGSAPVQKRPRLGNGQWSQEIIDEQQARTRAFVKDEGMEKVRGASVVVVGVGGVGSWVATMLVRSGVGKIRVVDFDQVSLSSLNRHACATLADVGTPKVECVAKFCRQVAPWVEVEAVNSIWTLESGGAALLTDATFVVDCIDNIDSKVDLLAYCHENGINVMSSMGAGTKADPTRIDVGDISATYEDPLSRVVRFRLRARGITSGIPVVYSTEKPGKDKAQLLEIEDSQVEQGNVAELSVLQDFRVRILPVLGPLPGLFGLTIATHLLNVISGYTSVFDPVQGGYSFAGKGRTPLYVAMRGSVVGQFARRHVEGSRISLEDVEYLIEEVWRGKTIRGQHNRQKLTLWDPAGPTNIHNMVPVTKEEMQVHEKLILNEGRPFEEVYEPAVLKEVADRMALDRWYQQFRVN